MLLIFIIWLYSNIKEIIYIHFSSIIIHASVYLVKSYYLALGIPAGWADEAALLIDKQIATVRALPG